MTSNSRVSVPWPVLVLAAVLLVALGASAAYVALRSTAPGAQPLGESRQVAATSPPAAPAAPLETENSGALPDVVVTLSEEVARRAGITTATASAGSASGGVRAPGLIEANAYKQVAVTPVISGRITRVVVDLGRHVQRGETLAQIFSPELAEWQTRYISAKAELGAHEQELTRTQTLVEIGAASRQELERIHAGHTARRAELESAASRLQLLGLSAADIAALGPGRNQGATMNVPAPITGVITARTANVGLNVDQATPLFTVTDLSSVWVVASLYEKDFARVAVGSPATVTTTAYPNKVLQGRVSYIDPQVNPETRTARVRIEVPNADGALRLGMYAEAILGDQAGPSATLIPRSAVQNVGNHTVVYVADATRPAQFIEREVRLGAPSGDFVAVVAGVQPGDLIVSTGSFSVRAERERLGLRAAPPSPPSGEAPASPTPRAGPEKKSEEVRVTVTDTRFEPQRVTLRAGVPARLTFTRISEKTCATAVVFVSLNIKRDLPLNMPVTIDIPPRERGELAFACGMNMLSGTVVVQ
jgi:RND family efflux transporter MFP subunit